MTLNTLNQVKKNRDAKKVSEALEKLKSDAISGKNMMEASIHAAKVGVTTGEWADTLREVFGEYNPPTGVEGQTLKIEDEKTERVRGKVKIFLEKKGHRPKLVVGKPGLDGHSNGAEMIAVSAKHAGFDVIYSGIRNSPEEIIQSAVEENADVIGLSILSGSHNEIATQIFDELKHYKADIPVIMGGIIPEGDFANLKKQGIREVFTPKDFDLMGIMEKVIDLISK